MNEMENVNSDNSENVLRERFSEAPTIDNHLWENIEKALQESDKRRRFILFRNLTLVLLVIGFSFSYLFFRLNSEKKLASIKEQDNDDLSKLNVSKRTVEIRNKKSKFKYHQSKKSANESISKIALKTKIEVSKIDYTENLSSSYGSRNQNQITATTNQNIERNSNLDAFTRQELTGSKTKIEINTNEFEKVQSEFSVNESKLTNNAIVPNNNLVNSKIEKVETSNKLASNNKAISTPTTKDSSVLNTNLVKSEIQNVEISENHSSNKDTISTLTTNDKDTTIENIAKVVQETDNQPKGIIAQPFKRWEVGFAITPAYSFRNLAATNSVSTPINSNERGTLKTNFGLNFGYHFNNNFKISGGVATLNYKSEFVVDDLIVYCDTDENTLQFDTDFGSIIQSQDDFEGEEPDENELNENEEDYITVNVKGSQTIQMIQFPILATLKTNGKKVNFFIEGGLTLNAITKSEFDVKIQGYEGITRTDSFNLRQITTSLIFNGGIEYKFSDSFSLQISPTFRYSLNSISSSSSSKIHPYWLGTNIALTYRF
ncbi:MAG: hypothetical protein EBQ94_05270 [Flavobacteriales bacterium]|nr:hypothetical protein [Flavobacteriales bacterium]